MTWFEALTIVLIAAGAAAVVLTRDPRRLRGLARPWLLDTALAAAAVAYVVIGAVPLVFHLPFLYHSFPLAALAALLVAAGGFALLLLRFLL